MSFFARGDFWDLLQPGVRKQVESKNCMLMMDGFVPAVVFEDAVVEIDLIKVEGYFDSESYTALRNYIFELCGQALTKNIERDHQRSMRTRASHDSKLH